MELTDKTIIAVTTSMLHGVNAALEVGAARAELEQASELYASGRFTQAWMNDRRQEFNDRMSEILDRLDQSTASNIGAVRFYASRLYDIDPARVDLQVATALGALTLGVEDGRRLIVQAIQNDEPMTARAYAAHLEQHGHRVTLGIDAYRERCESIAEQAAGYARAIASEEPTTDQRGDKRLIYTANADKLKDKLVRQVVDAEAAALVVSVE